MVQSKKYQRPAQNTARDGTLTNRIVIPDSLTLAFGKSLLEQTAPGSVLEVNGIVLKVRPEGGGFVLSGGITIRTSETTSYVGGLAADLAPKTPLQVEGTFTRTGEVVASRVTFGKRPRAHTDPPGSK